MREKLAIFGSLILTAFQVYLHLLIVPSEKTMVGLGLWLGGILQGGAMWVFVVVPVYFMLFLLWSICVYLFVFIPHIVLHQMINRIVKK